MQNSRERLIAQNMKDLQKSIFGDAKYHEIDLVKLTNITRFDAEDRILTAWPDVRERTAELAHEYNLSFEDAFNQFYIDAYLYMIEFIRRKHMDWLDLNKPELYDDIEKVKKLK